MTRTLIDADAAAWVRRQREHTMVADLLAGYRAGVVLAWLSAQGDPLAEALVLADARRYDATHPDEPSLVDELHATTAAKAVAA